jgi:hypothetical protein
MLISGIGNARHSLVPPGGRGTLAKKATGKQAKSRVSAQKSAKKRKTVARKTSSRRAAPATARRKTASRAAATRRRRSRPAPPKPSRMGGVAAAIGGTVGGVVAAVSSRLRRGAEPDAIEMLEREHRRFEQLLKEGEKTTGRARTTRRELLETLTAELNAHELMEEKVLYPALESHPEARDIVLEGYQEHHVADLIVKELHEVATNDEAWGAKFKVLKENIEHHIQEEEGEMFRTARSIFSREELRKLAAEMRRVRA